MIQMIQTRHISTPALENITFHLSVSSGRTINAYYCQQVSPEIRISVYSDTMTIALPDYMQPIPEECMEALVNYALTPQTERTGDQLGSIETFIGSSAYRRKNQELMTVRLNLIPPRKDRDLVASFCRVERELGLDIDRPVLGWSDRIPKKKSYFVCRSLDLIAVNTRYCTKDVSIEDLDNLMRSAVKDYLRDGAKVIL